MIIELELGTYALTLSLVKKATDPGQGNLPSIALSNSYLLLVECWSMNRNKGIERNPRRSCSGSAFVRTSDKTKVACHSTYEQGAECQIGMLMRMYVLRSSR